MLCLQLTLVRGRNTSFLLSFLINEYNHKLTPDRELISSFQYLFHQQTGVYANLKTFKLLVYQIDYSITDLIQQYENRFSTSNKYEFFGQDITDLMNRLKMLLNNSSFYYVKVRYLSDGGTKFYRKHW